MKKMLDRFSRGRVLLVLVLVFLLAAGMLAYTRESEAELSDAQLERAVNSASEAVSGEFENRDYTRSAFSSVVFRGGESHNVVVVSFSSNDTTIVVVVDGGNGEVVQITRTRRMGWMLHSPGERQRWAHEGLFKWR